LFEAIVMLRRSYVGGLAHGGLHHLHNVVSREITIDDRRDGVSDDGLQGGFIAVGYRDSVSVAIVNGGDVFIHTPAHTIDGGAKGPSEASPDPLDGGDNLVNKYLQVVATRDSGEVSGDVFAHRWSHCTGTSVVDLSLESLLPHTG
jgi:hypothetical protein